MSNYIQFEYKGVLLDLYLPKPALKAHYYSSSSKDIAAAFTEEGIQRPEGVELVARAMLFAADAHASIDHRRKYTGEPYVVHPIAVAEIVKAVPHTSEMIAAAMLHDTIEDTPVTIEQIDAEFGAAVAELVGWLTDVSKPEDGNRQVRKMLDLEHTARAPAAAKTIKIADLIDNTKTIKERDPDFWKVYRHEKMRLLQHALGMGDPVLWKQAWEQCQ